MMIKDYLRNGASLRSRALPPSWTVPLEGDRNPGLPVQTQHSVHMGCVAGGSQDASSLQTGASIPVQLEAPGLGVTEAQVAE